MNQHGVIYLSRIMQERIRVEKLDQAVVEEKTRSCLGLLERLNETFPPAGLRDMLIDLLNETPLMVDPNAVNMRAYAPLAYAFKLQDDELINLLLKRGALPDYLSSRQVTGFHLAIDEKYPAAIDMLVRYGGDPDKDTITHRNPVIYALSKCDFSSFCALMQGGADVVSPTSTWLIANQQEWINHYLNQHPGQPFYPDKLLDYYICYSEGYATQPRGMRQHNQRLYDAAVTAREQIRQTRSVWEEFCANGNVSTLSAADLIGFASIGRLRAALNPVNWHGHEADALTLAASLPPHLLHKYKAELSRITSEPLPVIEQWHYQQPAMPEPERLPAR